MNKNIRQEIIMNILHKLWKDRRGYTSAVSLLLVVTILGIGSIVGLATLKHHMTHEFIDVATSLKNLDQSFNAPCYGKFIDDNHSDRPHRRRGRRND